MKLNRYKVNLLQIGAAVLVMLFHAYALGDYAPDPLSEFTHDGCTIANAALFVFMFLSGFLVSDSYAKDGAGLVAWIEFWVKRLTRIWPGIAVVTVLMVLVLGPCVTIMNVKDYWNHESTWSYLQNLKLFSLQAALPGVFDNNLHPKVVNGSLWMIPWQMWFYVLISIFGFLRICKSRIAVSVLFLVVWFVRFVFTESIRGSIWMGLYPEQGMPLLAFFVTGWMFNVWKGQLVFRKDLAFTVLFVLPLWLLTPCADLALALLGGYVLLSFAQGESVAWLARVPSLSYSIFIVAFPIQQLLVYWCGGKMNHWLNFFGALVLTIPLAWLELLTVERFAGKVRGEILAVLSGNGKGARK